jgi:hypothetical protein
LLALAGGQARADIITQLANVTGSAGAYNWNYTANVTSNQTAQTGDYFEIRDFNGYNGVHSEPAGWTFVTAMVGPLPTGLLSPDDPTVPDLIWKYTGSSAQGSGGPIGLGTFTAGSTIGTEGIGTFVAQGTRQSGLDAGTKIANIGQELVPFAPPIPAGGDAVPEPSTLALLGVGLPLALVIARHRHRASLGQ